MPNCGKAYIQKNITIKFIKDNTSTNNTEVKKQKFVPFDPMNVRCTMFSHNNDNDAAYTYTPHSQLPVKLTNIIFYHTCIRFFDQMQYKS